MIKTGGIVLERLVLANRGGLLQANIPNVEPGAASDGQIVHVGEEVGYMLVGKVELALGDQQHLLQAGDVFIVLKLTASWLSKCWQICGKDSLDKYTCHVLRACF